MLSNISMTAIVLNYNKKDSTKTELEKIIGTCLCTDESAKVDKKVDLKSVLLKYLNENVTTDKIKEENCSIAINNSVLADILIANDVFNQDKQQYKKCYTRFCNPQLVEIFSQVEQQKATIDAMDYDFSFTDVMLPLSEEDSYKIIENFYKNSVIDYTCLNQVLDLLLNKKLSATNIPINSKFLEYLSTSDTYKTLVDTNVFVLMQDTKVSDDMFISLPEYILYEICNTITKIYMIDRATVHQNLLILYDILKNETSFTFCLSNEVYREMNSKHYLTLYKKVNYVNYTPETILHYKNTTCINYLNMLIHEGEV